MRQALVVQKMHKNPCDSFCVGGFRSQTIARLHVLYTQERRYPEIEYMDDK